MALFGIYSNYVECRICEIPSQIYLNLSSRGITEFTLPLEFVS